MPSEAPLIGRIARAIPSRRGARAGWLRLGIGDDAALLQSRNQVALSCDPFLESVHFFADVHPPAAVGFKSLARAVSDLAAMGAEPRGFLLGLSLPAPRSSKWLDGFLAGMSRAARRFGLLLVGGDVSRYPSVLVHITVIGEVSPDRAFTRSGARPGDSIFVSGALGRAQLGLEIILQRMHRQSKFKPLLRAHFYPDARLKLGRWLSRRQLATAAIDTSDGLSTDLARLCHASGVGARIWRDRIPQPTVPYALRRKGLDPLRLALHGGEDYELLFTVSQKQRKKIGRSFHQIPLTEIGLITRERKLVLESPEGAVRLPPEGWDHFSRKK